MTIFVTANNDDWICGSDYNHQTTTNQQQQQQPPISLPRGGEEVLINGAGHHHGRSRSYQKPSSRHHYGKHLFTSSSIDVAIVAESGTKTENTSATTTNGNIRSTIDSDPVSLNFFFWFSLKIQFWIFWIKQWTKSLMMMMVMATSKWPIFFYHSLQMKILH